MKIEAYHEVITHVIHVSPNELLSIFEGLLVYMFSFLNACSVKWQYLPDVMLAI